MWLEYTTTPPILTNLVTLTSYGTLHTDFIPVASPKIILVRIAWFLENHELKKSVNDIPNSQYLSKMLIVPVSEVTFIHFFHCHPYLISLSTSTPNVSLCLSIAHQITN